MAVIWLGFRALRGDQWFNLKFLMKGSRKAGLKHKQTNKNLYGQSLFCCTWVNNWTKFVITGPILQISANLIIFGNEGDFREILFQSHTFVEVRF